MINRENQQLRSKSSLGYLNTLGLYHYPINQGLMSKLLLRVITAPEGYTTTQSKQLIPEVQDLQSRSTAMRQVFSQVQVFQQG